MNGITFGRHWKAAAPEHEAERVEILRSLGVLEGGQEFDYRCIAALAAELVEMPMGAISLIDLERQIYKATFGFEMEDMPREESFCHQTVLGEHTLVIADAFREPRFQEIPLVAGPARVRFYAGVPLRVFGHNVGALCVMDRRPRQLPEGKRAALEVLASLTVSMIQNRFNLRQIETQVVALRAREMAAA